MGEIFKQELADTANKLIEMLGDCEIDIVEYVTDCVCNNGYVFVDDLDYIENKEN